MSDVHGRWAVPVSALALVLSVWASLQLSRRLPAGEAHAPPPTPLADAVSGFRDDAWYLPTTEVLGFIEIPAGPFLMGSDPAVDPTAFQIESWSPDGSPGTLDLPAFYIGRYEVTVAQFRAFVQATGYPVEDARALAASPEYPVAWVSWPDALAYGRWLDAELRVSTVTPSALRQRLADGWRVTLPTEAEWEKAARGTDGRIFPWGDELRRDRGNFGGPRTTPVGAFPCPECPYGLADMAGNVWEWTRSPYRPYPLGGADEEVDLEVDALWVMRGGSFIDLERNVRAAGRGGADPGARRAFIGFRLAITPPG